LQSIKFKSVIGIGTDVVDTQGMYIEVADNDMAINKNLSQCHFLLPSWLAEPAISSRITLSYRIIVEQHKGELKCFLKLGKGTKFRI